MNEGKRQGSNEIDVTINQKLQGFIKSGSIYSCTGASIKRFQNQLGTGDGQVKIKQFKQFHKDQA